MEIEYIIIILLIIVCLVYVAYSLLIEDEDEKEEEILHHKILNKHQEEEEQLIHKLTTNKPLFGEVTDQSLVIGNARYEPKTNTTIPDEDSSAVPTTGNAEFDWFGGRCGRPNCQPSGTQPCPLQNNNPAQPQTGNQNPQHSNPAQPQIDKSPSSFPTAPLANKQSGFTPFPNFRTLPQNSAWDGYNLKEVYDHKFVNGIASDSAIGGVMQAAGYTNILEHLVPTDTYTRSKSILKDANEIKDRAAWIRSQTHDISSTKNALIDAMNGSNDILLSPFAGVNSNTEIINGVERQIPAMLNTADRYQYRPLIPGYDDLAVPTSLPGIHENTLIQDVFPDMASYPEPGHLPLGQPEQNIQASRLDIRSMIKQIRGAQPKQKTHETVLRDALDFVRGQNQEADQRVMLLPECTQRSGFIVKDDANYKEGTIFAQSTVTANGFTVNKNGEIITPYSNVVVPGDPQVGYIDPRSTFSVEAERQRRANLYLPFTRPDNTGYYADFILPDGWWDDISDVQQLI